MTKSNLNNTASTFTEIFKLSCSQTVIWMKIQITKFSKRVIYRRREFFIRAEIAI